MCLSVLLQQLDFWTVLKIEISQVFVAGLDLLWWLMSSTPVTHTASYESHSNSTLTENNYILNNCEMFPVIIKIKILYYAQYFNEIKGIVVHDCNSFELICCLY